jgi:CHASE1-domain containing sensor protein
LIKGELEVHETLLRSMRAYFQNKKQLSQQDFDRYIAEFPDYQENIDAVAWIEYLPDKRRLDYEQQHGEIVELDNQGKIIDEQNAYLALLGAPLI